MSEVHHKKQSSVCNVSWISSLGLQCCGECCLHQSRVTCIKMQRSKGTFKLLYRTAAHWQNWVLCMERDHHTRWICWKSLGISQCLDSNRSFLRRCSLPIFWLPTTNGKHKEFNKLLTKPTKLCIFPKSCLSNFVSDSILKFTEAETDWHELVNK